ncbi:hypothetical protein [Pedobacter aquatilis]|uniref:hypothetical protein n=1 Tax=Pedobacter aquatilis TaxID=351343 RepID=UPI00292FF5D4|nr:hypothetical protein [Pedobacter aquatilis]
MKNTENPEHIKQRLDAAIVEERRDEQGQLSYVIKNGLDVKEYAAIAKAVLEAEGLVAHDFTGQVINETTGESAPFQYQSGWPLDGLGAGELE